MLLLFVMLLESFQPASSYGITISWILSTYIVWCLFADFVLYAHPYPWKLCWAVCMLWQLMSYFVTLFYLESINQKKKKEDKKRKEWPAYISLPCPLLFAGFRGGTNTSIRSCLARWSWVANAVLEGPTFQRHSHLFPVWSFVCEKIETAI